MPEGQGNVFEEGWSGGGWTPARGGREEKGNRKRRKKEKTIHIRTEFRS